MPIFVEVVYTCGCVGLGSPNIECPKHGEKSYLILGTNRIKGCKGCKEEFYPGEPHIWKEGSGKGLKSIKAWHLQCFLKKAKCFSDTEGKYRHKKGERCRL